MSVNIEKEGSGRMVTVALIISRSVTRSMRRPRDVCPMEELVSILGAGHCMRVGFVASTVQGWEGKRERGEEGKETGVRAQYMHVYHNTDLANALQHCKKGADCCKKNWQSLLVHTLCKN